MPANSPIQVVPTIATSGVLFAVIAVVNLSCAASHGIAVTFTLTPGLAASNSLASLGRFSPSAPMAQTVMLPLAAPELTALPVCGGAAAGVLASAGGHGQGHGGDAGEGDGGGASHRCLTFWVGCEGIGGGWGSTDAGRAGGVAGR